LKKKLKNRKNRPITDLEFTGLIVEAIASICSIGKKLKKVIGGRLVKDCVGTASDPSSREVTLKKSFSDAVSITNEFVGVIL